MELFQSSLTTYLVLIGFVSIIRAMSDKYIFVSRRMTVGVVSVLGILLLILIGWLLFNEADFDRTQLWLKITFFVTLLGVGGLSLKFISL